MSTPAEGAERRAYVLRRRTERATFAQIGAELRVSAQRAFQLYRAALQAIPSPHVDQLRADEIHLADLATAELIALARDTAAPPRSRVEAWHAVRSWSEHRARLLGLNAPTRRTVEVVTTDVVQAAIEQLEREQEHADLVLGALDFQAPE